MLRSFYYLDTTVLNDYVAQINGFVADKEEITITDNKNKNASASIGTNNIGLSGSVGKDGSIESHTSAKITDSAKFESVYKWIDSEEGIKFYDIIDENVFNDIFRGAHIEVEAKPRRSKLSVLVNLAEKISNINSVYSNTKQGNLLNKDDKNIFNFAKTLGEFVQNDKTYLVFEFPNGKYPFITRIDNKFLLKGIEELDFECTLFCKIKRVLNKGEQYKVDDIFSAFSEIESISNGEIDSTIFDDIPNEVLDIIEGPAVIVDTIAIYK